MKGDFSRKTFDPKKHYSSVRMQQGRVQLDSDWNEQQDITSWRLETEALDVIGGCGAPIGNDGFRIVDEVAGLTDEESARPGNADPQSPVDSGDFLITAGRFYADGILSENDRIVLFSGQEYYPNADPVSSSGLYIAYLDVWKRHVTALQDPDIREVALGGPDTATRVHTVAQVKMLRVGNSGTIGTCGSEFDAWNDLLTPPDGKLAAQAEQDGVSDDPCVVAPGAGYRRLENQLYRIEVHNGGARGAATFKWSRDNGSVAVTWDARDGSELIVANDVVGTFLAGDWIELTDETRELREEPGTMVRVVKVKGNVLEIDLASATGSLDIEDFSRTPIVRRWNNRDGLLMPADSDWVDLEDGVQIRISDGEYRTGDYWLVPARTATAGIEWPEDDAGDPALVAPHGIEHSYCRLAVMRFVGGNWTSIKDCRPLFPPVTRLTSLFYLGGDGQQIAPDPSNPGQLLPLPEKLRVGVANGEYPVEGAEVEFRIESGAGRLNGTPDSFITTTNDDGLAECEWSLDSTTEVQAVSAHLLKPDGSESHLEVRFSAALSLASRVAYQPGCDRLSGTKTVQEALDLLCALNGEGCAVPVKPGPNWREMLELVIAEQDRIHLCFHPGDFDLSEPIVFRDKQSVVIEGAGTGTRLHGKGSESVFRFECCTAVTLRDFYANSGKPSDQLPFQPKLNGVLNIVNCSQVVLERLAVLCVPGAVRASTCVTVRNRVDKEVECGVKNSTRVRSCDFRIGHLQTGVLVVNGERVTVEDSGFASVGRPSIASLRDRLKKDPKLRKAMANRILRIRSLEKTGEPGRTKAPVKAGEKKKSSEETAEALRRSFADKSGSSISEDAFAHDATTQITLRTRGYTMVAFTPLPLASMWQPLLDAQLKRRHETARDFALDLARVVEDLMVGKVTGDLGKPFEEWLEQGVEVLPAVASQGIVIGGTTAPDIRVLGNTIQSVRQGIHIGLSHREDKPSDEYDQIGVAVIRDNTIGVMLSSEMRGERHGIFVGNCGSLNVDGNFVRVERDGGSTSLRTEGVRIYGYLGPRMIARGNHIEGATIGIRVEPLEELEELKSAQWLVADTMASNANPVSAPPTVQQVNNLG